MTYNETVPVSSNSELAFGHPVSYPYEVHDNYVYIAGDDTAGAFRWGSYDRDTRTLTLMYNTDAGTVYAKLRHMGNSTQSETVLDEATLCTVWRLAEIEAADGSSGDARALGLEQYLVFLSDGTVRMIDTKVPSDQTVPYTMSGNTVRFGDRVVRYDPALNELLWVDPSSQEVYSYAPAPKAVLPMETDADASLSREQADAFVNGLSVEFEDGSPYGCDLVVFIDGLGTCLNVEEENAAERASLRFEVFDKKAESIIYTKYLDIDGQEYYLGDFAVLARGNRLYYSDWGWGIVEHHSSEEASIRVTVSPSMVERNREVTERACVIKAFDAENRTVTVSFVSFEEADYYQPAYILYDTVEEEEMTLQVTDDTFLSILDWYDMLVKPDRFFRYLEENRYYLNGVDDGDGDDRGIGFWIGLDGDTLLYLCEVYEE